MGGKRPSERKDRLARLLKVIAFQGHLSLSPDSGVSLSKLPNHHQAQALTISAGAQSPVLNWALMGPLATRITHPRGRIPAALTVFYLLVNQQTGSTRQDGGGKRQRGRAGRNRPLPLDLGFSRTGNQKQNPTSEWDPLSSPTFPTVKRFWWNPRGSSWEFFKGGFSGTAQGPAKEQVPSKQHPTRTG